MGGKFLRQDIKSQGDSCQRQAKGVRYRGEGDTHSLRGTGQAKDRAGAKARPGGKEASEEREGKSRRESFQAT